MLAWFVAGGEDGLSLRAGVLPGQLATVASLAAVLIFLFLCHGLYFWCGSVFEHIDIGCSCVCAGMCVGVHVGTYACVCPDMQFGVHLELVRCCCGLWHFLAHEMCGTQGSGCCLS